MKERPILFSAPMVRAILDGTKTMTRRVWKMPRGCSWYEGHGGEPAGMVQDDEGPAWWHVEEQLCPYGKPGDRLWVRETWARQPDGQAIYCADLNSAGVSRWAATWKPSIHMPRWASRILLEITDVRVERLQDISEDDARAEGIERGKDFPGWYRGPLDGDSAGLAEAGRHFKIPTAFPKLAFRALWESINGPKSWAANPWVWVVEFRRVETTEGA